MKANHQFKAAADNIEMKLKELDERRIVLESKIALRQATMAEFEEIRKDSLARLSKALHQQNYDAKRRNRQILEEMLNDIDECKPRRTSSTLNRLEAEKLRYSKYVEASESASQHSRNHQLEEKINEVKMETYASAQRRERLRIQLLQENNAKMELETQRRELMLSVALEQRELLEANAQAVLITEGGKIVNQSIERSIYEYNEDLKSLVAEKLNKSRQSTDELMRQDIFGRSNFSSNANENLDKWRESDTIFSHRLNVPNQIDSIRRNPLVVNNNDNFNTQIDHAKRTELMFSDAKTLPQQGIDDIQASLRQFPSDPVSSNSSPRRDAFMPPPSNPTSHSVQNIMQPDKSEFSFTASHSVHNTSSDDMNPILNSVSFSELKTTTPDKIDNSLTSLMKSSAPDSPRAVLPIAQTKSPSMAPHTMNLSPRMDESISMNKSSGNMSIHSEHSEQSTPTVIHPSISATSIIPESDEFGVDELEVTMPVVSTANCIQLLRIFFPAIENNVEFASVKNVYTVNDIKDEKSTAIKLIEKLLPLLDKSTTDPQNAVIEQAGVVATVANEVLGGAVQLIIQSKAELLIPIGSFAGVVTIDKLKKEYKKLGAPAGPQIQELWDLVASHLETLIQSNSSQLDFLSKAFTNMYIYHVPEDDKERLQRKVSKLLQLAMLPQSSADNSRSSSPTERFLSQSFGNGGLSFHKESIGVAPSTIPLNSMNNTTKATATNVAFHSNNTTTNNNDQENRTKYKDSIDFEDDEGEENPHKLSTSSVSRMFAQLGVGATTTTSNSKHNNNNNTNSLRDSSSFLLSSSGANRFTNTTTEKENVMTTKAPSGFLNSGNDKSRAAAEFDDDEIMDDEEIQLPPPLRDLDAENGRNANSTVTNKIGSKAPSAAMSWSRVRNNNDEFDF